MVVHCGIHLMVNHAIVIGAMRTAVSIKHSVVVLRHIVIALLRAVLSAVASGCEVTIITARCRCASAIGSTSEPASLGEVFVFGIPIVVKVIVGFTIVGAV